MEGRTRVILEKGKATLEKTERKPERLYEALEWDGDCGCKDEFFCSSTDSKMSVNSSFNVKSKVENVQ